MVCRQTVAGQRNRTIKVATVKRFHYDDHAQLRRHLADFMDAYNFGRRLKTLKGLTPYAFICKCWTLEPERFILNPLHQMPGLNTWLADRLAFLVYPDGCGHGVRPSERKTSRGAGFLQMIWKLSATL